MIASWLLISLSQIKDAYIHLLDDFEKKQRRKARKEKPASSTASDVSSMRAPSSAPSECASEAPPTKPEPERKEMRKHKEPCVASLFHAVRCSCYYFQTQRGQAITSCGSPE